jgi:hypothetical protein
MKSREDYDRAIVLTRRLVHEWDPLEVLKLGGPEDEFDDEIARLVARIPRLDGPEDAGRHVAEVFTAQFGPDVLDAKDAARMGALWYAALLDAGLAVSRN